MHLRELLAGYELGMTQLAKIRSHSTRVHPSRIPPKTYVRPLTWGADTHELCFYLPRCAHQVSGSVALTPPQKCFAFPVTTEENSSFLDPAHDEWDKRARYGGSGQVDKQIPSSRDIHCSRKWRRKSRSCTGRGPTDQGLEHADFITDGNS